MFLWDVLAGWSNINASEFTHVIAKETILSMSHIKSNNKILFYLDWYEKGIKLQEHVYDFRTQKCYTLEQLQNLYNIHQNYFL